MGTQVVRVFQLSKAAKWAGLLVIPVYLAVFTYIYFERSDNLSWIGFFIFPFIMLVSTMLDVTTKITITTDAIIRERLFMTRTYPLSTISDVKKIVLTRWSAELVILTDHNNFRLGSTASPEEINERFDFVHELLRQHYPEYYEKVKKAEHVEVEKFWRK